VIINILGQETIPLGAPARLVANNQLVRPGHPGKLRLTDPVSRFIPEFKGMKVAVMQDRPADVPAPAPG
jgi:hypothetical protein